MDQLEKNKNFVLDYFRAISGHEKTAGQCDQYMTDGKLKEYILFFESVFPKYELIAE